jgi:hypothetical protein
MSVSVKMDMLELMRRAQAYGGPAGALTNVDFSSGRLACMFHVPGARDEVDLAQRLTGVRSCRMSAVRVVFSVSQRDAF